MSKLLIPNAQETYEKDGSYVSQFLRYRGIVDNDGVLRAIVNANADAVTASWRTEGENAKTLAEIFDQYEGNGKETFKLLMNNAFKVAKIGGDYYGEIVYDSYDGVEGEIPVNIVTLPSDNIRQNIKNGRIKNYENIQTGDKYQPRSIFHLAYNPIGCMTHGNSIIAPIENLVRHRYELMEVASKVFERYVKPINVIYAKTDSTTEQEKIRSNWEAVNKAVSADLIVDSDSIEKIERIAIPQGGVLDPSTWHRVLMDQIIMSSRVPELALGTGSVNSEESAKMQFMGFRQMVRWDQKFLEENLKSQIINQIFPEKTPTIKWSFATEGQDERWNRMMETFSIVGASTADPELKNLLQTSILIDLGIIPNV